MSRDGRTSVLCLLLLLCSCGGSRRADEADADPLRERLLTYWDGWRDAVADSAVREQRIVDFLYLAGHADSLTRADAWSALITAFGNRPDITVTDYLGELDSPLYSPQMLEEYLAALAMRMPEEDPERLRAVWLLENIRKNRQGQIVADLSLIKADGSRKTLHRLVAERAGGSMILFYDPDCGSCDETIARLSASPDPDIHVIAVSVAFTLRPLPAGWVSTRVADTGQLHDRYYLPSLPVIYVVSSDGRIHDVMM